MTRFWQKFEKFVSKKIQNDYSNYEIIDHPILENGLRPDYILNSKTSIGVADAKEKNRLDAIDIKQITEYIYELDASFGIIYVSNYTKISKRILMLARWNNIKIIHTGWRIIVE